jgi:hypothetical protein
MLAYVSAVDRARRAFASVARLEDALARDPQSASLQINLAAQMKLARQAEEQLLRLAELSHVEVCNYRLLPATGDTYALAHVSRSMLEFQNLFSQLYDALKHGIKQRAVIGTETARESLLEFGYSYSGSLGIVLLAPSDKTFFEGQLDSTIDSLFEVLEISSQQDVRNVARRFGRPVVKRVYDWSKSNLDGGFATDVQWKKSDGRCLGQVVEQKKMGIILNTIVATSDIAQIENSIGGMLVGINVQAGTFQFIGQDGENYRGRLHEEFSREREVGVPRRYEATIVETRISRYDIEEPEREWQLKRLVQI